ncbi:hypothetical protein ACS0TY_001961 [Phlomoides rotata]
MLFVLISLTFPGLEMAFPGGNRRLLAPLFPGIPDLTTTPPIPLFPNPMMFPPLLPSPGSADPSTPSFPNFPQFPPAARFPGTPTGPFTPVFPPPRTATNP